MSSTECDRVERILRDLKLPKEVVDWEITSGVDATDEPGVWITLVIADDTWSEDWLRDTGRTLRRSVKNAIRNSGVSSWPYLTLLTASDYQESLSQKSVS